MKHLIKTIIILVLVMSNLLHAEKKHLHQHNHEKGHTCNHPEHELLDKKYKSKEIQAVAKAKIQSLIKEKKIPKSWKRMQITKIGKQQLNYTNDWVVVFENNKIKNKKRNTLYIFVDEYGEVRGANYSGK
jgi:hypothetical protein